MTEKTIQAPKPEGKQNGPGTFRSIGELAAKLVKEAQK